MGEAFKSVTKWVGEVDRADLIPEYTRRAYTHLRSGRPGPVLLLIPARNLGEYDPDSSIPTAGEGLAERARSGRREAAIRALPLREGPPAPRGEGVATRRGGRVLQFAEAAQIPVLTTLKAKGVFPRITRSRVGVRGTMADHFLSKCDLLFSIGSSHLPGAGSATRCRTRTRRRSCMPTVDTPRHQPQLRDAAPRSSGDARLTLQALISELEAKGPMKRGSPGGDPGPAPGLQGQVPALARVDETPINPYRVFGDLAKVLDPRSSFPHRDSGQHP
jgi:thiamine pyrophosphate-dependent acetolactate synthase large subunit-like protein